MLFKHNQMETTTKELEKEFVAVHEMSGIHDVKIGEVHSMKSWMALLECAASTFEMYASYGIFKEVK